MSTTGPEGITYILPLKASTPQTHDEFAAYLRWLASRTEVIIVDGSPPVVFSAHAAAWGADATPGMRHVAPDADLATPMGKVGSVLTGLRLASNERVIIGDEDVRYEADGLRDVVNALDSADVVRPQNYFDPLPWHARWDTGRMLLNRVTGGDWPGTLGVRRSMMRATGGYDGRALFENLELVRTVIAAGGREVVLFGTFVLRRPATARHFWSQRVRQAYDELARPVRLLVQLAVLPVAIGLLATGHPRVLATGTGTVIALAELGRRRSGGRRVFPASSTLLAPAWLAERALCIWLALASRVFVGGVAYRGTVLRHAATPMRVLRARHAETRRRVEAEAQARRARHRSA